ncbi:DEAD/H associated domain protein [Methanotorris igneus Kol 5]|uniref:DEAD/H associated domain protein n=1 Tax=Methanotorris igneus (strain DSM 5666 / JCM 11834 / Kol 5) TaxID=880724 RepID=F6BEA6_METIK|nr:DEAD/H associated domain protein [Methanotorris igneus Kol 5]
MAHGSNTGTIKRLKKEYSDEEIYAILEEPVKEWFKRKYGAFTPPQRYAVMEIHKKRNVLISSPTGSGKTLSAFLAAINELISLSINKKLEDKIYVLYVSPLRALNNDIEKNLKEPLKEIYEVAKELGVELDEIRVAVRTSDTTSYQKSKMVKKPPHILITTPESLAIALNSPKFSEHLKSIRYVIVDEIHALTNKRGVHLALSLERLNRIADFVRIGLSATVHPLEEVAKFLVGVGRECLIVDVNYLKDTEIKVISPVDDLIYTPSDEISKKLYKTLKELIEKHRTTLIFTNTRSATERVVYNLRNLSIKNIEAHHSSLSREHRLEVEEKLKKGELRAVVCVAGDSKILTDNGIKMIKELYGKEAITGIENGKVKFVKFRKPHKIKYSAEGLLIRTSLGFEVKATKEHKFLTVDENGKLKWIEAENLKAGNYIAVLRKLPSIEREVSIFKFLPDSAYLHLKIEFLSKLKREMQDKFGSISAFAKKMGLSRSHLIKQLNGIYPFRWDLLKEILRQLSLELSTENVSKITTDKGKYHMPLNFTPFMARLLGFWMADGSWKSGTLTLFSSDLDLLEKYGEQAKREFGVKPVVRKQNVSTYALELSFKTLMGMFKALVGNSGRKSKHGTFPKILYSLPLEHKKQFLSGYFDGDGYLEIKNGRIFSAGFTTFNREFADGIRDLLLYFGIVASIRKRNYNEVQHFRGRIISKRGTAYTVSVLGGEYLRRFFEIIEPWRDELKKIKEFKFSGYSNRDVIPNMGKRLRYLRLKLGISTYKLQKELYNPEKVEIGERQISRRNMIKLLRVYLRKAEKKGDKNLAHEIKELLNLAEGDIFFDKIKEIKPTFIDEAYGIIDSETENYVVNGFISKNSSTSLELGIDIGSIDLVILLGSPKSVSRALQRIGRSGHRLHEKSKGIIIAFDRDDLVECTVLAHNARNRKIDKVHIPKNCLDVLCQHIVGMSLEKVWEIDEAYNLVRKAYPYKDLSKEDFLDVLNYLAKGMEEKSIYGKIWLKDNRFGKRGKSTRAIYYMNVGTIPDETSVAVYCNSKYIGEVEEEFAEKLMRGDIFVLGGKTYKYIGGRGNRINVKEAFDEKPTIPAWFSEQLPLAYDLALDIQKFRGEVLWMSVEDIMEKYQVDEKTARAIKNYITEQDRYAVVPNHKQILIEHFVDEKRRYYVFHFLIGRRANDAISRAFAYYVSNLKKCNVRVSISDNGFALILPKNRKLTKANIVELFNIDLEETLKKSLERAEILKRRFRHVATRGFMILRKYMGRKMSVNRQQFNAEMLIKYCREINHPLYRETIREILEDVMDIENAKDFMKKVKNMRIYYRELPYPSPFAFNLIAMASSDVIVMEDKKKLIMEMHKKVMEFLKNKVGKNI